MCLTGTSDLPDIARLAETIRDRGAKRVALQFPDGLRRRASEVAGLLRAEGFSVIISGDPCYGACDLALDALGHADVLVHFGHTPVSSHKNVIYEPYFMDFDTGVLAGAVPLLKGTTIGLVTTVQHVHMLGAMQRYLEERGFRCLCASGGERAPMTGQVLGCSFRAAKDTRAGEILFVGTGLFHPSGVQLVTGARVIALDPYTGEVVEVKGERFLRKRHALITKAGKARNFGVLACSKSGQKRMALARSLTDLSEKAFLVLLREITHDVLQNLGFDAYVNTGCPRLSYDDQDLFPAPVLSPPEFEIVVGQRHWDDYLIDEIE